MTDLAAITKPELKRLIDTLSDCACFITDNMDETNVDEAGLLLARCDNVLDACGVEHELYPEDDNHRDDYREQDARSRELIRAPDVGLK